jgi:hypothetical protein
MRPALRLGLLLAAAFLLVSLCRLPLRWTTPLLPASLHCESPQGSLWDGRCASLSLRRGSGFLLLGDVAWQLRPLRLLAAKVALDVKMRRGAAQAAGRLELGITGQELAGLAAQGPLEAALLPGFPPGWSGTLEVAGARLRFKGGNLVAIEGTLVAQELTAHVPQRHAYGSYELRFAKTAGSGQLPPGIVTDQGGPLELHATLQLKPSMQWTLEGDVAARPNAEPDLTQQIEQLGSPDAKGLRHFAVGSL